MIRGWEGFFAVDPLASKYPHNSVYAFSENRVIDGIELEGLEVVLVHGTWAKRDDRTAGDFSLADYKGGSTWKKQLGKGLASSFGYTENQTYEYSWTGTNKAVNRRGAAIILANKLMDPEQNPYADEKHAVLIGHSHGGNVNKEVQKILKKNGWTVDIVNIATPQRKDHQISEVSSNEVYVNFYSSDDLIQWLGTDDNYIFRDEDNVSNFGPRIDLKANVNKSVDGVLDDGATPWFENSGGHSYHQESQLVWDLMIETVNKALENVERK
jgi:hypothetical protein